MSSAELVCAAGSEDWLAARREGITATDIVTIAGLVTWDSPWALYHRKLGLLPEPVQSDRMRLGSWLEDQIAGYWSDMRDSGLYQPQRGGLYRSTARLWQLATPDWLVIDPDNHDLPGAVLECKTSATRDGWGDDGSDEMPAHVRAQVLWQMNTLGVSVGHVAVVFLPSGEFRSYTIRHNDCERFHKMDAACLDCGVCAEIDGLRDLGFGFWSRILTRRPPDLDGLEVTTEALKALHYAPENATIPIPADLVEKYDEIAELRRVCETGYRKTQNQVRDLMGDADQATVDGRVVFRRTVTKRAGYTVPPGETDTLRRIGKDKTDG